MVPSMEFLMARNSYDRRRIYLWTMTCVGSEDGKDEVRTDGEDDGTNEGDEVRN